MSASISTFIICLGPVVIGGRFGKLLVGVTSFGPNDTENNGLRKNFDVDVFHYADWIMNTINSKGTGRLFTIHKYYKYCHITLHIRFLILRYTL